MSHTLHLLDEQQVISYSCNDGSFQVWDLERGTQVGKEWEDKEKGMYTTALSPDSKTIATGNEDGSVKLWNIDTSKIIETWMGHTNQVQSLCWSPDGGRVVSGYRSSGIVDATFRVWDVESGKTILGPIGVGQYLSAVCYSPDGKMIATSGDDLEIWDANSGELLAAFEGFFTCLAWTSDGKTLIAGKSKIDTATWTILDMGETRVKSNSLSPNGCILASTPEFDRTVQLWNLETNKPIGTSLHHEDYVNCTTFSADGRFLFTICINGYIYRWDLSAIVKEAGLHLDIVNATPRPAPKMKGVPRIPAGFFDDALREANLRIRLSQSHELHNHPTSTPRQRTLSPFYSFWHRSKLNIISEREVKSRPRPFSWTWDLSGLLRRQDESDIQLQDVEVPCTAGKPRNYHATGKKAASLSRPPKIHATQQPSATTQSTPPSSQQPPPTAAASTLSVAASTPGTIGAVSRPNITIRNSGWRTRLMLWVCCMPIQNTDSQH